MLVETLPPHLTTTLVSIAEAMLIGILVGIQRQSSQSPEESEAVEARDFVIVALTGAVCAIAQAATLTVVALLGVTALIAVHRLKLTPTAHLTSDFTAVATFCLGYLTAVPNFPHGTAIAVGTSIALVAILEAKERLQRLVREDLTEAEFLGTLRFLAIVFVIYPLIPAGRYGPYEFFEPRSVWIFVILVSSISYLGYFLEKFLAGRGITLMAVLGGVASTTAATVSFARRTHEEPGNERMFWYASVVANLFQLPRLFAIAYAINPQLAGALLAPVGCIAASSLLFAWLLFRQAGTPAAERSRFPLGNPFQLVPALKFGALFAVITLLTRWAATEFGSQGLLLGTFLGGAVDVDAVTVTLGNLLRTGNVDAPLCTKGVLLAIVANGLFKIVLALTAAGVGFARKIALSFLGMYAPGFALAFLL